MVRADAAAADLVRPCLLHITGDYWGWFGSRSYHHTGMVSLWYASEDPVFARLIADWYSSMRRVYIATLVIQMIGGYAMAVLSIRLFWAVYM